MPKADIEALQKHTLHLFEGDYAVLASLHPEVPTASIIRRLVRAYINKLSPPIKPTDFPETDLDV